MGTREVSQKAWKAFCERINGSCTGTMVSIELQQPDGTTLDIARDVPLVAMRLDAGSDPCNTQLVIEAGEKEPVRHVVVEPIHIRLKTNGQEERYGSVQIIAENGTTTALLRPGVSSTVFNGLEIR